MPTSWAGIAAVALAAAAPQAETPPPIDGVWVLNADESDDARDKFQEAMRDRFRGRRGGGGRPGGGRPGGGRPGAGGLPGGGFPGGGPGGEGGGGDRDPGAFLDDYQRLEIASTAGEIQIAYGERLRIFRPDGREVERRTERGLAKVKARWDDGRLVIEADGERTKSREVFEIEADSGRLVLTQVIDGRMGQVKIRRVYDRGETEDETPEAGTPASP